MTKMYENNEEILRGVTFYPNYCQFTYDETSAFVKDLEEAADTLYDQITDDNVHGVIFYIGVTLPNELVDIIDPEAYDREVSISNYIILRIKDAYSDTINRTMDNWNLKHKDITCNFSKDNLNVELIGSSAFNIIGRVIVKKKTVNSEDDNMKEFKNQVLSKVNDISTFNIEHIDHNHFAIEISFRMNNKVNLDGISETKFVGKKLNVPNENEGDK